MEKVNFNELRALYLYYDNKISDIKVFDTVKFYKLEILDLSFNEIDLKKYNSIISNLKYNLRKFDYYNNY